MLAYRTCIAIRMSRIKLQNECKYTRTEGDWQQRSRKRANLLLGVGCPVVWGVSTEQGAGRLGAGWPVTPRTPRRVRSVTKLTGAGGVAVVLSSIQYIICRVVYIWCVETGGTSIRSTGKILDNLAWLINIMLGFEWALVNVHTAWNERYTNAVYTYIHTIIKLV